METSALLQELAKSRSADVAAERLFLLTRIQDLEAKLWTKDPQAYRAMAPAGTRPKRPEPETVDLRASGGFYDPVLGTSHKVRKFSGIRPEDQSNGGNTE